MKYPNFKEEDKLLKKGLRVVVGIDEAGRGPLAGPVVAASAIIRVRNFSYKEEVRDSKKLTPKKRQRIYDLLMNGSEVEWGIGIVSEKIIDKINILEASKLAMEKSVLDLSKKIKPQKIDFLLLDGNFKIKVDLMQKSIIGGDDKVLSIATASIIAKVTRDKMMEKYHKQYPLYGFDKHKGYGTKLHFRMLEKYGLCKIHRKTFKPVSNYI